MSSTTSPQAEVAPPRAAWLSLNTTVKAVLVLTGLAGLLLFQAWPTFGSYFMVDDFMWLAFGRDVHSAWTIAAQASPGGWTTPIPNLVFYFLFQAFGYSATGYYLTVLLLHLVNICLIFSLVFVVVRRQIVALVAAALFAVLFLHWSDWGPLVWISAFVQLIAALFYIGSITLFIHYLRSGRTVEYVVSIVLFCCALLSKETALSLPLVLVAAVLLLDGSNGRRTRNLTLFLIPFFSILMVYLLYELRFQASGSYVSQGHYGLGLQLITNWVDFSNLVLPNPNSGPVQSFMSRSATDSAIRAYGAIVFSVRLVLLAAGLAIALFGSRVARFWLAFMIVTYFPFLPWGEGFAGPNRYFYLPAIGFSALLAFGAVAISRRIAARLGRARAATFFLAVALVFWAYNLVPTRIWQQQMAANSYVRQAVVQLVKARILAAPGPAPTIQLRGFPEKYKDLGYGLTDLLGVKTEWKMATQVGETPARGLIFLDYTEGCIELHE